MRLRFLILAAVCAGPILAADTNAAARTKTIAVVDPMFGNMPAFKVTIPADWTFDGAILRSSCGDGLPFLTYRAYSPDKLSGAQMLPQVDWYYSADPRAFQFRPTPPCNLHAPARAADAAPKIATDLRPGARVEAAPPLTPQQAAAFNKQRVETRATIEQANRQYPPDFRGGFDLDAQSVQLRYDFQGKPIQENLFVRLATWDNPVTVSGTNRQGILQPGVAHVLHTNIAITGIHAPAGHLEETIAAWQQTLKIEVIPDWERTQSAMMQQSFERAMQMMRQSTNQTLANGEAFAAQMKASNDRYHAWQAEQGARNRANFEAHMQAKDSNAQNFLDYVKDQTYYVNPSTGATTTIQNIPGVSGYVGQTSSGNWTQLIPISH